MTSRAPRYSAMVEFMQYRKRECVVLEEDHEKALAAKDARIAELETALSDVKWCMHAGPSCQVGLTERCGCAKCVTSRIDASLAGQQQAEPATHSEDGREVVGYLDHERKTFSPVETDDHRCPLIYLANFERIVAAKDAEIARLKDELQETEQESERWYEAFIAEGGGL